MQKIIDSLKAPLSPDLTHKEVKTKKIKIKNIKKEEKVTESEPELESYERDYDKDELMTSIFDQLI